MKSTLLLTIFLLSLPSLSKPETITIDLHHPDFSPISPLYDPSLSHYQRVANALHRLSPNLHRPRRNLQSTPSATIQNTNGDYLVTYAIGTPPVTVHGLFDTGSDLIWTPCNKLITPKSKSLQTILCNSPTCQSFNLRDHTCRPGTPCSYGVTYADSSSTKGSLSTETITLGSAVFTNITFGCAAKFSGSTGSLGFGGGAVSLVRQLVAAGRIKPVFSYCLASIGSGHSTSRLHLGNTAAAVTSKAIGLFTDNKTPTFFLAKLGSIAVGKLSVGFGKNVILSTGTGSSKFPISFYNSLLGALNATISSNNVTQDPSGVFDLCYKSLPGPDKFPKITLVFGGVGVTWTRENVFAPLGPSVWCFPALPVDDDQDAILGSIAQVNFLVGFNLKDKTVTFEAKDCSSSI